MFQVSVTLSGTQYSQWLLPCEGMHLLIHTEGIPAPKVCESVLKDISLCLKAESTHQACKEPSFCSLIHSKFGHTFSSV